MNWSLLTRREKSLCFILPFFFSLIIGAVMGSLMSLPFPNLWHNILYWTVEAIAGVYTYLGVIILGRWLWKKEFKNSFKDHWPQTCVFLILVYLLILAAEFIILCVWNFDPDTTFKSSSTFVRMTPVKALLTLMLQAACLLIIYEFYCNGSGFYRILEKLTALQQTEPKDNIGIEDQSNLSDTESWFIKIGTFPKEWNIPFEVVSHITVENHFSTLTYKDQLDWKQWGAYTPLNEFENKYTFFLRINRSTLINPNNISSVKKNGRQYQVFMVSDPETPMLVSRAKSQEVKQLISNT